MIFRTQYDDHDRVIQPAGSRIKRIYASVFDEKGHLSLQECGKESFYDYIQSFKDSVDIHVLLKRFANGEVDVLNKVQGAYGDFTEMPKTYAEMLNIVNRGESFFNELPVETRAKFDHNFAVFLSSMDQPGFLENLGLSKKQIEQVEETVEKVDDVKEAVVE